LLKIKRPKTHFWKKFKNKAFSKKFFLALKALFFSAISNMLEVLFLYSFLLLEVSHTNLKTL